MSSFGLRLRKVLRAHVTALIAGVIGGSTGSDAPDAPLYYYSFTDAMIAGAYQSLPTAQQVRLDPMITGFNPADMYAVDHIRRVLELFRARPRTSRPLTMRIAVQPTSRSLSSS